MIFTNTKIIARTKIKTIRLKKQGYYLDIHKKQLLMQDILI